MKKLSNKIIMMWALFVLFVMVCLFKDQYIAGIVATVFTITINYLFRVREREKTNGTV